MAFSPIEGLYFYNTASQKKEPFFPNHTPVRLYTCGPTVYDYAHIGNFRTYVFEDVLKRTLLFFGYSVTHVMNITDVEDKTIAGACKKNISLQEYTEPYIEAFFEDLNTLNIAKADFYPHATHYIPQMIQAITNLLEQGIAYVGQEDPSIYFSLNRFPNYGKLSHLDLSSLRCSSRVSTDEYDKENPSDFVLWKAYNPERDGTIYWESPFGKGRPGWHLECSIMAMELLGDSLDIHVGGVDNIFPHHENEIAQSEALSGKPFVRYWLHSEHLLIDGKKMSKSLGNFFTLRDLLNQGFTGQEVRYMLLQSHYRMQLNFTEEALLSCRHALRRLKDFVSRLEDVPLSGESPLPKTLTSSNQFLSAFSGALANDLNVSTGFASLFDFVHEINSLIDQGNFSKADSLYILEILKKVDSVLGVLPLTTIVPIPATVMQLVAEREEARKAKNWAMADILRNEVLAAGFLIEDNKSGPKVKPL
ncbi:cysteine--tRNA ligase [Candidatus Chlamydia corallus]|uniref:cysteine--tRNA ligase n=1 Tax=Candidatus Chlamydia corallus TaxID=2038470 RepID=UPI000C2FD1D6|nr:cysteine--tRNA ligase [Candidatus Chlamydia corallus]